VAPGWYFSKGKVANNGPVPSASESESGKRWGGALVPIFGPGSFLLRLSHFCWQARYEVRPVFAQSAGPFVSTPSVWPNCQWFFDTCSPVGPETPTEEVLVGQKDFDKMPFRRPQSPAIVIPFLTKTWSPTLWKGRKRQALFCHRLSFGFSTVVGPGRWRGVRSCDFGADTFSIVRCPFPATQRPQYFPVHGCVLGQKRSHATEDRCATCGID